MLIIKVKTVIGIITKVFFSLNFEYNFDVFGMKNTITKLKGNKQKWFIEIYVIEKQVSI